jgi:hypothetical protein
MCKFFKVLSENERFIVCFELIHHNQAKFLDVIEDKSKNKWCLYREVVFLDYLYFNDVVDLKKSSINSEGWFSGQIIRRYNNGNIALVLNFKDGKLCGINKGWFENTPSQLSFKVDVERGREKVFYEQGQIRHSNSIKNGNVKCNSFYENKVRSEKAKYTTPILESWEKYDRVRFYRFLRSHLPLYVNKYLSTGEIYSCIRRKGVYVYEKNWYTVINGFDVSQYKFDGKSYFRRYYCGVYKVMILAHSTRVLDIYKNDKKRVEIYKNNRRVIFTLPNTPKGIKTSIKIF